MIGSGAINKHNLKQSTIVDTLLFSKDIFKSGLPENAVMKMFLAVVFTSF